MKLNSTELRRDLYNILDRVIESGEPAVILRKGHTLRIIEDTSNRLDKLEAHTVINGDDEALVHLDWSGEWRGEGT